jgi:hypothetical protein
MKEQITPPTRHIMNKPSATPLPTAWAETELRKAHEYRERSLNSCVVCAQHTPEFAKTMSEVLELEKQLTELELAYNKYLIKLNSMVVHH